MCSEGKVCFLDDERKGDVKGGIEVRRYRGAEDVWDVCGVDDWVEAVRW
jgi:hypothetical protein